MDSVGDLARTLVLRTNQTRLRQDMDRLAVEVATGFVRDPAGYLQGDTTSLLAIDRALARLDVFRINTAEAVLVHLVVVAVWSSKNRESVGPLT